MSQTFPLRSFRSVIVAVKSLFLVTFSSSCLFNLFLVVLSDFVCNVSVQLNCVSLIDLCLFPVDLYLFALDFCLFAVDFCLFAADLCLYEVDFCPFAVDFCLFAVDLCLFAADLCLFVVCSDSFWSRSVSLCLRGLLPSVFFLLPFCVLGVCWVLCLSLCCALFLWKSLLGVVTGAPVSTPAAHLPQSAHLYISRPTFQTLPDRWLSHSEKTPAAPELVLVFVETSAYLFSVSPQTTSPEPEPESHHLPRQPLLALVLSINSHVF